METFLWIVIGLLCALEVFVVAYFLKISWPKSSKKSTIAKCSGSLIFIITAIVASFLGAGMTAVASVMLVGFCMSLVGDFWLDQELTEKHIFLGIVFFFTAHLCYIAAFLKFGKEKLGITSMFTKTEIIAIAAVFVVAAVGSFVTKMQLGKLIVPVGLYSIVIATMVVKAITTCVAIYNTKAVATYALVTLALGALLFIISDLILSFMYFGSKNTKGMRIANIVTYFSGQMLLAISLSAIA